MHFEFPIEQLVFDFELHGNANIHILLNGKLQNKKQFDNQDLNKDKNIFTIKMLKSDPKDIDSFARMTKFQINGSCYLHKFKSIEYTPEKKYHAVDPLSNDLYFGYIGTMEFEVNHENDLISKAAWTLANNEFEYVKWPLKGNNFREKTFENITRDSKFMFTGSLAPQDQEISTHVENLQIKNLRQPVTDAKQRIEQWMTQSHRVKYKNFDVMKHMTFAHGISESLNSFINRANNLYLARKKYFFIGEVLDDSVDNIKDPYNDTIEQGAEILLEFPSPWYSIEQTQKVIQQAKKKGCKIALDLIWLPVINHPVEIDLSLVDEIFFSMNKTWPIHDIRPGFRWSKERVNDWQTLQTEHCSYQKIQPNIFLSLIDRFEFDYTFAKHKENVDKICSKFNLSKTNILWFANDGKNRHDDEAHTSRHLDLDEFICVRKLLDYQGKYFW